MLARGSTDGFEGSIWPLTRCTHQNETIQQAVKDRYGKQGVLEKESPSFFGGWSQRYVVLRGQKLIYK